MVYSDNRKAKFDTQKISSKVKVTGVKKTLKMTVFKLLPLYFKKFLPDFDELWQNGKE